MGLMITYLKNEFNLRIKIFQRECYEHMKMWKFKQRCYGNLKRIGPNQVTRIKRNIKG